MTIYETRYNYPLGGLPSELLIYTNISPQPTLLDVCQALVDWDQIHKFNLQAEWWAVEIVAPEYRYYLGTIKDIYTSLAEGLYSPIPAIGI